ncbi:hypothetical protein DPX16_1968 [Anabarilius grahami]|uniref:Uncharacterized protein n=1 Tax=Anabarilius grahami TaxID=495550 RepID=A0A3N0YJK3_ANAGA|nr:hypothetical protein DPX16_1968 [Anabarilius grahami]
MVSGPCRYPCEVLCNYQKMMHKSPTLVAEVELSRGAPVLVVYRLIRVSFEGENVRVPHTVANPDVGELDPKTTGEGGNVSDVTCHNKLLPSLFRFLLAIPSPALLSSPLDVLESKKWLHEGFLSSALSSLSSVISGIGREGVELCPGISPKRSMGSDTCLQSYTSHTDADGDVIVAAACGVCVCVWVDVSSVSPAQCPLRSQAGLDTAKAIQQRSRQGVDVTLSHCHCLARGLSNRSSTFTNSV